MSPKNSAAVELGRKGGRATARNRTSEERADAARKAVEARWAKIRKVKEGADALLKVSKAKQKKEKSL